MYSSPHESSTAAASSALPATRASSHCRRRHLCHPHPARQLPSRRCAPSLATVVLLATTVWLVSGPILTAHAASPLLDTSLGNRTFDQMTAALALSANLSSNPWVPPGTNPESARLTILNLLRIQRELQLSVPIHLLPYLGLDSRARFGANYSAANIDLAIDPLAWGYRRISFDLYWDAGRLSWQLCPVPYPYPIDTAVNATQFINDRDDVILDVPRDLRDRVGGSATVVCQARPGGADWKRLVTRLYNYVVATHRDKSDLFFALIELRTWDLGIAPRNATSSTILLPTPTLPPGLSVSTSVTVSTIAPGTTTTILVPVTLTLSGSTTTTSTTTLLEPTPPSQSTVTPGGGAGSPSPNPTDSPTASLGNPLYDAFNMTLFVPRDMVDQLTKISSADKPYPYPWMLSDAQYNINRPVAIPNLDDAIRSSPIRRLAFIVSDHEFFTSRTPANYQSAQQDRQYLLTWQDFGVNYTGAIAPVPGPPSDQVPLVNERALSGGFSSGGSLLGPSSPPTSPPNVVDCPWMYGGERGVQVSGNETLPGIGGDWLGARSPQPGRRLSPSVLTVSDANSNGANRFNPGNVLTLASCGYAPYVSPQRPGTASNGTIDDATLASYVPLANAWLWSPMKPQNTSDLNCALASVPAGNASTAPITTIALTPAPCLDISYIACQSLHNPHAWTISTSRFSWINAAAGTLPEEYTARGNGSNGVDAVGVPCPADYFFSVPRTPLQSWALAVTLANSTAKSAWVFLSDSRSEGCWTVGGLKCRYGQNKDQRYDIITVSLFGGLLVLLLFGIFLWVKWRRYNRVSREESRAAMAKRTLKQIEYTSIPA